MTKPWMSSRLAMIRLLQAILVLSILVPTALFASPAWLNFQEVHAAASERAHAQEGAPVDLRIH